MQMSKDEIVRKYKEAKNKKHVIEILADLNTCDKSLIRTILTEGGISLPGNPNFGKPKAQIKKPIATEEETEESNEVAIEETNPIKHEPLPDVIRHQLLLDADAIDNQIMELVQKKQAILDYVYRNI